MNLLTELAALRATHASTLQLLTAVSEYLRRLPPVPLTRELCEKIDEHVRDPRTAHVNRAAALNDARRLNGGAYTTAGIPLVQVDLDGQSLKLFTGIPKSSAGEAENLAKLLALLRSRPTIQLEYGAPHDVKRASGQRGSESAARTGESQWMLSGGESSGMHGG